MKAVVYEAFGELPQIQHVADPTPTRHGVVIRGEASGVCRSDFHGWGGHDLSIEVPNVPGHEFAGVVEAVGTHVTKWKAGDRVTVPFVGGCGSCTLTMTVLSNSSSGEHKFKVMSLLIETGGLSTFSLRASLND